MRSGEEPYFWSWFDVSKCGYLDPCYRVLPVPAKTRTFVRSSSKPYVYIHMHIRNIHTYVCVCIYVYIHVCVHIYIYMCIKMQSLQQMNVYLIKEELGPALVAKSHEVPQQPEWSRRKDLGSQPTKY